MIVNNERKSKKSSDPFGYEHVVYIRTDIVPFRTLRNCYYQLFPKNDISKADVVRKRLIKIWDLDLDAVTIRSRRIDNKDISVKLS